MQGIFQKENTDKALKYGIYRHLPTYEKIIRNLVSFSVKEFDVLYMLYSNPGMAFTKQQIYEAVWHEKANGYFHAVENTIFQIRKKIKKYSSDKNYIKTVVGYGYKFEV